MAYLERLKYKCAVFVILKKDNKVLLLERSNTGQGDGKFVLPAGHIEAGETVFSAAIRELKEEVGISVDESHLKFVEVIHRKRPQYIYFILTTNRWLGEPRNLEEDKCKQVGWFDLDNLPQSTSNSMRIALDNYRKKTTFSEY